ncbi:hypothetical protein [Xanthovirga aplysinae]|uniref:hypothetical protein n=1 Tax=Xanthovirga aplysinae TaxID=2529853 RepID=UPI0012BD5914|nr:hypothetical protein [Xanthovirga aplysinae]MTI30314.1 hypothetical protein [Xanthovirga aplysinae]
MTRRQTIKVILFSGLVLISLTLISTAIQRKASGYRENDQMGKINRILNHELDPEISIWGASTALVHFDAQKIEDTLHLSCYNMGLDGTAFIQYQGILRDFIKNSTQAKYIIIALNINELKTRENLYKPNKFFHHIDNSDIYNSLSKINPQKLFKLKNVPFYNLTTYDLVFYRKIFGVYKENEEEIKGFNPKDQEWKSDKRHMPSQVEIDENTFDDFKEVIAMGKRKKIQVVLTVVPFYKEGQEQIENLISWQSRIAALAAERGIPFLNYLSNPICSHQTLFYNNLHLNARGADLFTDIFIEDLRKLGL